MICMRRKYSVIFSLVDPVHCCLLHRGLPDNGIRFANCETQNPTSFPGWPSFGDVLCDGPSKTLIGLTFHARADYSPMAEAIARMLSPTIAEFKGPHSSGDMEIYKDYPGSSWLEIKWSR